MRNLCRDGVAPSAFVSLALAVLLLPLRWILAAITAAVFHECCHLAAVKLLGGRMTRLTVGTNGAVIQADELYKGCELCCILAGPIGGLLLLLFARWVPALAVCALVQSCYNLLPLEPLDGGRALRCLLEMLLPPRTASQLCQWMQRTCIGVIIAVALLGTLRFQLGIFPLLLAFLVIIRTGCVKFPCKPGP